MHPAGPKKGKDEEHPTMLDVYFQVEHADWRYCHCSPIRF
jgi:hypothetical protein